MSGEVVVVGAGLAGAHVVTTLREEGYTGPVTLVGDEPDPPYERPPLSKGFLQGAQPFDEALVHPADWYAEHDVDLRLGVRVTSVDRKAHRVPRRRDRPAALVRPAGHAARHHAAPAGQRGDSCR